MSRLISIHRDGQDWGHYTPEQVHGYIACGRLVATDLACWHEQAAEWRPLGQLPEFAFIFGGPPQLPTADSKALPIPGFQLSAEGAAKNKQFLENTPLRRPELPVREPGMIARYWPLFAFLYWLLVLALFFLLPVASVLLGLLGVVAGWVIGICRGISGGGGGGGCGGGCSSCGGGCGGGD